VAKPIDSDSVVLSTKNTMVLSGEVNGESVSQVIQDAKNLGKKSDIFHKSPIYLFLNTPGGTIQGGFILIEALNGLDRTVSTVTLFAASMGFQIVQNLKGERLILKNGVLMSHRAAGEFEGQFGGTSPSQVESRLAFWNQRILELDIQTVKRTNGKQTLESYQKSYANEMWVTGSDAVKNGYADRIVTVRCDSSLNGVTTHQISFMGLSLLYDLSKCPIDASPTNIRLAQKNDNIPNERLEEVKNRFIQQYTSRIVEHPYW
jgi:ATP-dependent protease ClpP protease subunit